MQDKTDTTPWYKQFWPWFIMVPPITAILASGVTIWLAMTNAPDLVVADYGKIDETVAQDLRLAESANTMGLQARIQLDQLDGTRNRSVSIMLSQADTDGVLPGEILLRLVHPTRPEFDRQVLLVLDGDRYRGAVEMAGNTYLMQLEDRNTTWRLSGNVSEVSNSITLGTAR